MAGHAHFHNVRDIAFKTRLLQKITKDEVLDPKRTFSSPSDLMLKFKPIIDEVAVHKLLFETESTDSKLAASWKSAFENWNDRILELIASDVSDKSLAGVWLLGLSCREYSSNHFLESYIKWFNELLAIIQSSASSQRVKVASCASLSDLLTRLAGFQTVKDGATHAGKAIQPIVKLLNDDDASVVWETAAHLLSTTIQYFPSSVLRHYDSVESAVVSRMSTVNSSAKLLERLAFCLALLPKIRGNEELMLKRVLVSINILLDNALEGLDEESKRQKAVSVLLPPGSSPLPLGEVSNMVSGRSKQLLMRVISTLMQCFSKMLSGLYPVQVTLPVHSVLATIERVLTVDGSVPPALVPMTTTMQQEAVCAQLPVLHQYSLEALKVVVTGINWQLLPYAGDIANILITYLKKYTFPSTRVQVYSIINSLLVSFGAGIALYLFEEVIVNASVDLNPNYSLGSDTSKVTSLSHAKSSVLKSCSKKRKAADADANDMEVEVPEDCPNSNIALKIAALQALEALLRAGLLYVDKDKMKIYDGWRSKIDALVFTTATNACKRWVAAEKLKESNATWTDFQLAALDAFLASLLAPARVRPAHLSQGLQLFRNASQLGGPIAQTCARARLLLDPLLRPRALPLPPEISFPQTNCFAGLNGNTYDENIDFLNDIHMEKDEDLQVPVSKSHKTQNVHEQQLQIPEDHNADKMMVDSEKNGDLPNEKQEGPVSREGVTVSPPASGSSVPDMEPRKAVVLKDPSSAPLPNKAGTIPEKADLAGSKRKLSKDDDGNDSDSGWSLSSIEVDPDSDEADSASD